MRHPDLINHLSALLVCVLICDIANIATAQDWKEFRGPAGTGHAAASDLPVEWTEENQHWKTAIPGRGWSSPVITDDEIWLTTAIEIKATGAEREEMLKTASMGGLDPFSSVKLQALCVDRNSGQLTKTVDLFNVKRPPLIHALNSFASPTCVINGEFVFCSFGSMGTACLNRNGTIVWKNADHKFDHQTGPGSSPIIWKDLLIIHCDGTDYQYVVALDKTTGREVWRQARTGKMDPRGMMQKAFSTPTILSHSNHDELISPAANWVYSYDPATGKELWKAGYGQLGFSNVPRPIIGHGKIYICTGFMRSALLALNYQGKQTVTSSDVAWRYDTQVPTMPSPILVEDNLFMVSDRGIATCLNAMTGEQLWQQRLGGEFSSSPILADGKLFFGNRNGNVFVVAASDKFELIADNQLDSAIMATPAAVGKQLIVRTTDSLYSIQKSN